MLPLPLPHVRCMSLLAVPFIPQEVRKQRGRMAHGRCIAIEQQHVIVVNDRLQVRKRHHDRALSRHDAWSLLTAPQIRSKPDNVTRMQLASALQ